MAQLIRPTNIQYGMPGNVALAMQQYAAGAGAIPQALGQAIAGPMEAFNRQYEGVQADDALQQKQLLMQQAAAGDMAAQQQLAGVDPAAASKIQEMRLAQGEFGLDVDKAGRESAQLGLATEKAAREQAEFEIREEARERREIGRFGNRISVEIGENKRKAVKDFYDAIEDQDGDPAMFGITSREEIDTMNTKQLSQIGRTAQAISIEALDLRKLEAKKEPLVKVSVGGEQPFKVPSGYMLKDQSDPSKGVQPIPGTKLARESKKGVFTDAQAAAAGYTSRMEQADAVVDSLAEQGELGSGFLTAIKGGAGVAGRYTMSPTEQQVIQAQDDWIRAKLRKESGATIGEAEDKGERKTYFPQPGDSDAVIAQKKKARATARKAMKNQSGGAYKTLYQDKPVEDVATAVEPGEISSMSDADLMKLLGAM